MSELIQKNDNRATIRWKLLTGASALVLTAYVSSASLANAEDGDRPLIWMELGGQFNRLQDGQEVYAPPFVALTPAPFAPPQNAERPPLYGLDESAALTFQREGSNWIFSASIQYGRASSGKHVRHQSYATQPFIAYSHFHRSSSYSGVHDFRVYRSIDQIGGRFTDAAVKQSENHFIVDFQAGKDLGLGLFGSESSSNLSIGVRIAQFRSKSRAALKENPDWHFATSIDTFSTSRNYYSYHYSFYRTRQNVYQPHHTFAGNFRAKRSFNGVGPSVSWNSSIPFAGNRQDGELALDWGINAALLFGRQKVKATHQTTAYYDRGYFEHFRTTFYRHGPHLDTRSRNVTVPNVGGFAGISFSYADAKVSLGYKADFFFGAIDGGIDAAKKENRGFFGPFASISIGLGD